jgi:hypothetical protein
MNVPVSQKKSVREGRGGGVVGRIGQRERTNLNAMAQELNPKTNKDHALIC